MKNNINERNLVLSTLKYISDGLFVDSALKKVYNDNPKLEKRQKSFIKKVVYGVVENRIFLDYYINHFSNTRTKKMSTIIRLIMELSAYQIIFMDSVPDRAVINEAVKLTKKRKIHRLSGFVNAVLRKLSTERDKVKLPDDKFEKISVKFSIPISLIDFLKDELNGREFDDFVSSLNDNAKLSIRTNSRKIKAENLKKELIRRGVNVENGDIFDYSFKISNYDSVSELYGFEEGFFQVQDESSTIVGEIIKNLKPKQVLDLCAAPGGKSTHIAEDENISLISCDVSEKKVDLIKENIARLGLNNVKVMVNDASVFNSEFEEKFDLVLCDVPCSGLGVIRKKPDIKFEFTKEGMNSLVNLQRKIIDNALKYVKKGGYLVYSTCTITSAENQGNLVYILEKGKGFTLQNIDFDKLERNEKYIRLLPKKDSYDGFFISLFKKE